MTPLSGNALKRWLSGGLAPQYASFDLSVAAAPGDNTLITVPADFRAVITSLSVRVNTASYNVKFRSAATELTDGNYNPRESFPEVDPNGLFVTETGEDFIAATTATTTGTIRATYFLVSTK